jgi:hypothetical protein
LFAVSDPSVPTTIDWLICGNLQLGGRDDHSGENEDHDDDLGVEQQPLHVA